MKTGFIKSAFCGLSIMTIAVLVTSSASAMGDAHTHQPALNGKCTSFKLPVAPAPGQPKSWKIAATYCQPKYGDNRNRQIDVLTHGATYKNTYWAWPQNPKLYSYVNKTLEAGRATFHYDRIGAGKSSRPVSTEVTMEKNAYVLHQIIKHVRHLGYKQVNSIGHSMGSATAMREAATYKDVDRLVLTGYLHPTGVNQIVKNTLYPANLDPMFKDQESLKNDPGWLTSTPATATSPSGKQIAYFSKFAEQKVVDYDDATKDLVSQTFFEGYLADRLTPAGSNIANQIEAPVLVIAGQLDFVFCFAPGGVDCSSDASVRANEAPYYTNAAKFTVITMPNTGHNLTLEPSANKSFYRINQWIKTTK